MTRKRFVKLLMARGRSRNEANEIAERVVESCLSYEDAYISSAISLPEAFDAIKTVFEEFQRVANAVCVGMSAFAEAFRSSLNT